MSNWQKGKQPGDKNNETKIIRESTNSYTSVTRTINLSSVSSSSSATNRLQGSQVPNVPFRSAFFNSPSSSSVAKPILSTTKTSFDAVPITPRVNINYQPAYPRSSSYVPPSSLRQSTGISSSYTPLGTSSVSRGTSGSFLKPTGSSVFTSSYQNLYPPSTGIVRSSSLGKISHPQDFLSKELKVKVKKAKKSLDDPKNHKVPVYMTHSKKRGNVLIVNNIKFVGETHRKGAEIDERNIYELFKQMGFGANRYQNLSIKDLRDKVLQFRNNRELKKADIAVMVFMSHGTGTEQSNSSEVIGVDGASISTAWIVEQFTAENCPDLARKPKIFIFQCCRGAKKDIQYRGPKTGVDGSPVSKVARNYEDMLIAYSTVPGFVSHRDLSLGTWYIQAICKNFMEHAHDTHVEDLFKLVDIELSRYVTEIGSRQTSSYENRGFKICYLNPK